MSPIVKRCSELCARLERLKKTNDAMERASELDVRRADLEELRIALSQVKEPAEVLLGRERLSPKDLPDCTKALESCAKVEQLLDPAPLGNTKGITAGQDYSHLLKRVRKVADELRSANAKSWTAVVTQHQGVDDAFLRKVEAFPGQAKRVAGIRVLLRDFQEAIASIPANEETYRRFEVCYAKLQEASSELDPKAFPEPVRKFFRSAQSAEGARLDLFTDDVRQWLDENGLVGGVRVRFMGEE